MTRLARMTVRTALAALTRNPLRSALTMLGVVIGVAAVVAMVSVGKGADASVQEQISNLGTNIVMVFPGATTAGGVRSGAGSAATLTVADARAIGRECPSARAVTWVKREIAQVSCGNRNWSTGIQGSPPSYPDVRDWPLAQGRFFTIAEEDGAAKVAVLGRTIVEQLFAPGEDPIGATIRVKNVPFLVIGVLGPKGQTSWGQDQDDVVIVPFNTAERRVLGNPILGTVNLIVVSTATLEASTAVTEEITHLLHERHRTPAGGEDDFTVRNMREMFEASLAASRVMTNLLAAIASISLLVGGIGIMNTLLVSVTERRREIGIRMAVGAKARHILAQFLVESTVLSLFGGLTGTLLGVGTAALIGRLADWPIVVSPAAVALAFLFAAGVGLLFGVYPARRAARLDPIAALHHE
ncbi:MAG: ABC transporter permease [Candidatus Binatia bacterium]